MKFCSCIIVFVCITSLVGAQSLMPRQNETITPTPCFTANAGQWNAEIQFAAIQGGMKGVWMKEGILVPSKQPELHTIQTKETPFCESTSWSYYSFINPSPKMTVSASNKDISVAHFYLTSEANGWYTNVPNYNSVCYKNVWDGVDINYQVDGISIKQEFIVESEGKLAQIHLKSKNRYERSLRIVEAYASETGKKIDIAIRNNKEGDISFASNDTLPIGGFVLCTEFLITFGTFPEPGIHLQTSNQRTCIDSEGSMIFTVNAYEDSYPSTLSYPTLPSTLSGGQVITKLGCDKSTVFSAYFGVNIRPIKIMAGIDNSIYVLGSKTSGAPIIPLTSDALFKDSSDSYIVHFGEDGQLLYGSYIAPGDVAYSSWDMVHDRDGNVYVCGSVEGVNAAINHPLWNPWPTMQSFTPNDTSKVNVYQHTDGKIYSIGKHFVVKYNSECNRVLKSTYFPRTIKSDDNTYGFRSYCKIQVDSSKNLYLVMQHAKGAMLSGRDLPVQDNGVFSPATGMKYLAKFDSSWQNTQWSCFIGGTSVLDHWGEFNIALDKNDNVYIATELHSPEISVLGVRYPNAIPAAYCFLAKFSADGILIHSARIGSIVSSYADELTIALTVDNYNSVIFTMNTFNNHDMPETHRRNNSNKEAWIVIVDSMFSTIPYCFAGGVGNSPDISVDELGYIYSGCSRGWDGDYWQLTSEYQYADGDGDKTKQAQAEALIMRLKPPLDIYPTLAYTLNIPDSIYIALRRGIITPKAFTITYTLENKWSEPLNNIDVTLDLPYGIQLDPPNQPVSFSLNPSSMLPNEKRVFQWSVVLDTIGIKSLNKLVINVRSNYEWASLTQHCPQPNACGKHIIPVIKEVEQEPDLACELVVLDTLQSNAGGTMYQDSVVSLRYTIQNNDNIPVYVASVKLEFDPGMAIRFVQGYTKSVGCGWLQPGEYKTYTWDVIVSPRFAKRDIEISVTAYDTVHYSVSVCTAHIAAPGAFGLTCSASGPEWITVTGNTYKPDSIILLLDITNHLDTAKGGSNALILLENTRLGLPAGETALKYRYLTPGVQRFQWTIVPEASTLTTKEDTAWFAYWSASDTVRHYCMHIIQYNTLSPDAHCSINAPSTLAVDNYDYTPNPFDLKYTLNNLGTAQLDVASVSIQLPPDFTTSDPLTVTVTPLVPNGKHDLQWELTALTSAYARDVTITVTTYDSENKPVVVCEHYLFLPVITDMSCEAQSISHIVYNKEDRRYEPNPATASLVVYNHVDTIQSNIEAEIDVTNAPHLKLASGEANPQSLTSLAANTSHQFDWKLDVLPAETQVSESIVMRYRSANHPEWRECTWTYIIDEEAKIYSATCIAGGIDSLWLNGTAETIIPNPFQVYYTITNTGTGVLSNCYGTIALPAHMPLMSGEPQMKYYGNIDPGVSVQRSWMIGATPSIQSLGMHDIAFSVTADNLTTDVPCAHRVIISQKTQIDLALSHKKLYFESLKDAPALPTPQQIMVFAGSPVSMPWMAQGYPTWLDVQPNTGNTQAIDIQPNTTGLTLGAHTGAIQFASSAPNSPKNVDIIYHITDKVGVEDVASINGMTLNQNYPNPFTESTTIGYNLTTAMQVTLSVYNTLGNMIYIQHQDAQPGENRFTVSNLQPGLYMYVLATPQGTVSRRMVRR